MDHGTANFNLVKLETGIQVSTVPEPSTTIVGAAGALLGLGYAVCRRRAA